MSGWRSLSLLQSLEAGMLSGLPPSAPSVCRDRTPRASDCSFCNRRVGRIQPHTRAPLTSPRAFDRQKGFRTVVRQGRLLFQAELYHSPFLVGIAERGEHLSVHAKVRVLHVRTLDHVRKAERDCAELISSHAGIRCWWARDDVQVRHFAVRLRSYPLHVSHHRHETGACPEYVRGLFEGVPVRLGAHEGDGLGETLTPSCRIKRQRLTSRKHPKLLWNSPVSSGLGCGLVTCGSQGLAMSLGHLGP